MNYDSFSGKQKLSLIYLTNVGMVYTGFVGTKLSFVLLIIILYLYEEFFQTEDSKKTTIITNPFYKFLDFCYLSIFKDQILWICVALFFESYTMRIIIGQYQVVGTCASFLCLLICYHRLYAEKFHLNTITKMFDMFNQDAYTELYLKDDKIKEIFNFITEIEDKSYFSRPNTYSWFSFEFIIYRLKRNENESSSKKNRRKTVFWKYLKSPFWYLWRLFNKSIGKIQGAFRGHSTIEMQYLRMIGVLSNHRKNVISRKIYELIYTKIFFTSVKDYYLRYMYAKSEVFKEYIIYEYVKTVPTKINGKAFENENIIKWDINSVAVAVLGLNSNYVYRERLELYSDIFQKYGISQERVLKLAEKICSGKLKRLPNIKKKQ